MLKITLTPELEMCFLGALMKGEVSPGLVKAEELSHEGQYVHEACQRLRQEDVSTGVDENTVLSMAVDVLGADDTTMRPLLHKIKKIVVGKEVNEILRGLRENQILVELSNEISQQLAKKRFDRTALTKVIEGVGSGVTISPASDLLVNGIPEIPTGIQLDDLPALNMATGGLFGLWAIAGEPGAGKSTLAMQIAVRCTRGMNCLYYDFENGSNTLLHRLGAAYDGDLDELRKVTQRLYIRDTIKTLDSDLGALPAPGLIVIDSVQKLPTSVDQRRTALDKWVHKFEALKKRGYTVILVSEKDRGSYGIAKLSGFKETGEIEYSADIGIQLIPGECDDDPVNLHIVKNRHRPKRGFIVDLTRENGWRIVEEGTVRSATKDEWEGL